MAYDTLSPYAGAYPQTKEEIPTSEATGKAMRQAGRDLGVGSLRFGAWAAMAPEIDWLVNRFGETGAAMMMADPSWQDLQKTHPKETEDFHKLWLASKGLRGDKQHQKYAKKKFNKYHDMGFWAWAEQTPEVIDKIVPFENTLGSEAVEDALILLSIGWGVYGITRLLKLGVTKGVPWLRNKIKSIVKNKQGEEVLDDIVPEASLQIEHKPPSDARIDKTVEKAVGETPLQRSGDLMNQFLEEAGMASDIKISPTGSITTPKTKPKTMEELDKKWGEVTQKWQQKVAEAQSKYDQEMRAIIAANQTNPEKFVAKAKALDKRTEKRVAEMKKKMNKEFDSLEEQQEIFFAAERESISVGEIPEKIMDDLLDESLLKTDPEHFQGLSRGILAERTKQLAQQAEKKIAQHTKQRETEIDELMKEHKIAVGKLIEEQSLAMDKAKGPKEIFAVEAEYKARLNKMFDRNKVERDETYAYFERQWEAIEEMYYSEIEKIEDAFAILKEEEAVLPTGKITRHSRGGLVENKVNYALNQWK